jgi:biotin carboxyl carrier protein
MIEVMKLFTTIRAGIAGTVREICVSDGQMVEFGQDLMWIEPA